MCKELDSFFVLLFHTYATAQKKKTEVEISGSDQENKITFWFMWDNKMSTIKQKKKTITGERKGEGEERRGKGTEGELCDKGSLYNGIYRETRLSDSSLFSDLVQKPSFTF